MKAAPKPAAEPRKRLQVKVKGVKAPKPPKEPELPHPTDWRTTDEDEVRKRQARAKEETFGIRNLTPAHPVFSNFQVNSGSGLSYSVELRDLADRTFSCTCTDFRINGLGTCKHVEAVLNQLQARTSAKFKAALKDGSPRIDLVPAGQDAALRIERGLEKLPAELRELLDAEGATADGREFLTAFTAWAEPAARVSQEVTPALEAVERAEQRILLRRDYEAGIREKRYPEHVTRSPLFPYQREGMLHLAFGERALLADEMGLGKTIQAIAACALLHQLGKARRVLVVTPASLKAEWEEQIARFTPLPLRLIYGGRAVRAQAYAEPNPPFFTIVNYEQVLRDTLDINESLQPDIIVLDEAQRIKNWSTQIAQAAKRLKSRYAFVLSGTPLENRIDELRSLVDFLDPAVLGPLFRFNREFYLLDEKGRPQGYKNLGRLRERVAPLILRRRKADVETELPDRTDRNLLIPLTPRMRDEYNGYEQSVAELASLATRRPLTPKEQDRLMLLLNCMRMICDSPSLIKNTPLDDCPKLDELARVLEEALDDPEVKVIVFSEWEAMLRKVRDLARDSGIGYAWHTGTVPQKKRRAEILAFRQDPACRLFLSTDSGGVGLNLQNASVVINCDLPWNPAKLEQRIARAWRKNQRRAVTVVNLIAERTIEHGMLATLAQKSNLARGILDGHGELEEMRFSSGGQGLLKRLEQVMAAPPLPPELVWRPKPLPEPARQFVKAARRLLGERFVQCEELWIEGREEPLLLLVGNGDLTADRAAAEKLRRDIIWMGGRPEVRVVSPETWAQMREMAELGLITLNIRARRDLTLEENAGPPPLSAEELNAVQAERDLLSRKLRAAQALIHAGLPEDAAPHLAAAALAKARVTALERRWKPPQNLVDGTDPPFEALWPAPLLMPLRILAAGSLPDEEDLHPLLQELGA
jgi:hypothetical protein